MGLNMKGLFLVTTLLLSSLSYADARDKKGYYQIGSVEIEEVSNLVLADHESHLKGGGILGNNPIENIGRVIALGKDIVALGESVYQLVLKGKPSAKTTYAPISVIPREGNGPVDIFELEGFSMPVKKTYQIKYNNLYGVTIAHFMFSVMYSYGGSFNGTGSYLTSVQIVPEYVKVLWGWDLDATMKLGGIQNMGTRANPNAGATLMIEYTVSSILESIQRTSSFFVTGKGLLKPL
jgi:hypothetical protein